MDRRTANSQWPEETADLPSFYSPKSRPHEAPATHLNADTLSLSPLVQPPTTYPESDRGFDATQLPPPSLLSPQFTPPATPSGAATPTTEHVPRGVPVDSSLPTGGCGSKRPRLLETLPEVQCIVRARIPTVTGTEMWLHLYSNNVDTKEHLAIVFGNNIRSRSLDEPREDETEMDRMIRGAYVGRLFPGRATSGMMGTGAEGEAGKDGGNGSSPLVRIHSECYTGETAWSARCDCGEQLDEAARLMSLPSQQESGGIIIYLRQEGRGIGLGEKLKAYNLQDLGSDTVEANLLLRHPADARSYGLATAILRDLGQEEIRLLTNNPEKIRAVEGPNREVKVLERVAMVPLSWKGRGGFKSKEVEGYLKTKIEKMGHMLEMGGMGP
ncbi:GTP cyclohydrolase II-domain-containing protein [Pseudomassariella vexata]|uniref:GTP cyclohydrolase II n=1 Tax=Pseudomassariella vexata TaxID=1141098 RepID=A0A1Y2ECW2_9PEZI|nr:GTP cyclohydrolase II-domain-containing protein [Pseudomassariella vexata]ORY69096.1 GTP cyclohydrolase II-domain-containing protein [Pseudomassariella vexata]